MSSQDTRLSVCIARVWSNKSKDYIYDKLNSLNLGDIGRIDLPKVKNPDGSINTQFNIAFIHYHQWNPEKMDIRQALIDGTQVKVIYEEPWFWLLTLSRSKKPTFESTSTPTVEIGSPSKKLSDVNKKRPGTPPPSKKTPALEKTMSHEDILEMTSSSC